MKTGIDAFRFPAVVRALLLHRQKVVWSTGAVEDRQHTPARRAFLDWHRAHLLGLRVEQCEFEGRQLTAASSSASTSGSRQKGRGAAPFCRSTKHTRCSRKLCQAAFAACLSADLARVGGRPGPRFGKSFLRTPSAVVNCRGSISVRKPNAWVTSWVGVVWFSSANDSRAVIVS